MKEIESDGFITRDEDLMMPERKTLEYINIRSYISVNKASPMKECLYPECEKCIENVDSYCTVPMVFSKRMYLDLESNLHRMSVDIECLEKLVYDEILGESEAGE